MIARCLTCHRRVWPWQRQGWLFTHDGRISRWHSGCYR